MMLFKQVKHDCKVGIKAVQNIRGAYLAFQRLSGFFNRQDHLLLSSTFHYGVIKYAKPFINSNSKGGSIKYPEKVFKGVSGFVKEIHAHLIDVRNTLVAHDDFNQIEPKLSTMHVQIKQESDPAMVMNVPVAMTIANKCISYPADLATVKKMTEHIEVSLRAIQEKLSSDLKKLRQLELENPELLIEGADTETYGTDIPAVGFVPFPPELSKGKLVIPSDPDFSDIHNGFKYETLCVHEYLEQQKIKFPNGEEIDLSHMRKVD